MQKANEEVIIIIVSIVIILLFLGVMFLLTLVYYQNKKKRLQQEKEEMEKAYQQAILQSQIEIQEQTLRTISQEIHDNIGQILSLVSLNVSTIPTTDLEKRSFTRSLVTKAIGDLRSLSKSLNPERIQNIDLEDAIAYELKNIEKSGDYETQFIKHQTPENLTPEKKIILFRMMQEVMNNIIKHAHATTIKVEFSVDDEYNIIEFTDNGVGFILDEKADKGIGLGNIQKRAEMIATTVKINSAPKKGTSIKFMIKK